MKKIILGLLPLLALFLVVTPVKAQEENTCVDDGGEWVEETYVCPDGYEEFDGGEKACRKLVEDFEVKYKKPLCDFNYKLDDDAWTWGKRCKRVVYWLTKDAYQSPTCPEGYVQDELMCSKTTDKSYYKYDDKVSNEDGYCKYPEEPEPEPEIVPEVKKEKKKVFHSLKGCYEPKPETPQWAIKLPAKGGIKAVWSAMGGEKVDIEVTNAKGEWEYLYHNLSNDGHEFLPNVSMGQLYRVRVIRVCTESDWLIDP